MNRIDTEVLVIGAGPGGYAAAFEAADLGLGVTLVAPEANPGGVCLYRGCIPSKALLHVASLLGQAKAAADFGVKFGAPDIDLATLRGWTARVVERLTSGLGTLTERRGVRHIRGIARFTGAREVEVDMPEQSMRISFRRAIIATGSRPRALDTLPFSWDGIIDSSGALALESLPESLLIVGGGYIGLEMASVYARLGSAVTIVEATAGLLPGVDRDLVDPLHRRLSEEAEAVLLEQTPTEPSRSAEGIEVTLETDDGSTRRPFEQVLVAVGRRPRTRDLGLEKTRVGVGPDGTIAVDDTRRTDEPTIYAIGDVTGQPMLAHVAHHEGRVAARAIAGQKVAFAPRAIQAVVYTDPEIAWCGLTESHARDKNLPVETASFPWGASGRAMTLGRQDGITKLLVDPGNGRILGAGASGPGAGELIAEIALAMEMGATARDVEETIHPHPTLSETWMEAAQSVFGSSTHSLRT